MENTDLQVKGRIFDIQKFSIHDGPGIRTIVFLKGCVLRCRWCCNPESQSYKIETMVQNGKNVKIGCDTTVGEVMEKVMQDLPYYRRSGGGLTLSGGECLCQADFATALLRTAKANGISTAIETTACMPYETIERFLPCTDVFLMDIKHTDSLKHEAFTTLRNELIIQNARRLARDARELIIRVPTIPGFNDTEEEIRSIAAFAKSLGSVRQMHLLPYHRLGYDKYVGLGREYKMGDVPPPSAGQMERLKAAAESTGMTVVIGG